MIFPIIFSKTSKTIVKVPNKIQQMQFCKKEFPFFDIDKLTIISGIQIYRLSIIQLPERVLMPSTACAISLKVYFISEGM